MILTKSLITSWNRMNKDHYINCGYIFTKMRDKLEIKIEHLLPNSNFRIDVKCNECGNIYNTKYYHYFDQFNKSGSYICRPCNASKDRLNIDFVKNEFLKYGLEPLFEKYQNAFEKLPCKCLKHRDRILFTKYNSLQQGFFPCLICSSSKGESKIRIFLDSKMIIYKEQKIFKDCMNKGYLKFDFYLPEYNLCIEYDGKQHFRPIEYFGGKKKFQELKIRDQIKTQYCKDNNIRLLRIPYLNYNKIEKILELVMEI